MNEMSLGDKAFELLLYALALVGMAGVWLIPAHLWAIAVERRIGVPLVFRPSTLVVLITVLTTIALSLWVASDALPRVFQCLADSRHCSANRAGGLLFLSTFGSSVVLVETIWLVSRQVLAWQQRHRSKLP